MTHPFFGQDDLERVAHLPAVAQPHLSSYDRATPVAQCIGSSDALPGSEHAHRPAGVDQLEKSDRFTSGGPELAEIPDATHEFHGGRVRVGIELQHCGKYAEPLAGVSLFVGGFLLEQHAELPRLDAPVSTAPGCRFGRGLAVRRCQDHAGRDQGFD